MAIREALHLARFFIDIGWAAAFLCGALAYFQVSSSRGADRRLAYAGFGATRVALARLAASAVLGVLVSVIAFITLWLRSGIEHPVHAAAAIFAANRAQVCTKLISGVRSKKEMFSAIVPLNMTSSCRTVPILARTLSMPSRCKGNPP